MNQLIQDGDIVTVNNADTIGVHKGQWRVDRVLADRIGRPCWLTRIGDGARILYPYPSDCLTVVRRSGMTAEQRRIRQLEREVEELKNRLR